MGSIWGTFLGHDKLYIRWRALRVTEASDLLQGPSFDREGERYPFVFALSSRASLQQLEGRRDDLALRVRFLLRRRGSDWRYRLSRRACADAVAQSQHPLQTMACSLRLLGMHGAEAIPPLLDVLRTPPARMDWDDRAECAAWALGRLGRVAVPEILQELRGASQRVRRHLCTALWYMGPGAGSRAAQALAGEAGEFSTAALLAMEAAGSLAMVQARRGPVWLDEDSVKALAEMVFSDGDRRYAAAALGCFGPAYEAGLPLLRQLALDPDPAVRLEVAAGLSWGGRPDALGVLYMLCHDQEPSVAESASEAVRCYGGRPDFHRFVAEMLGQGGPRERRRAAQQLALISVPERMDDLVFKGLFDPDPEVALLLLRGLERRTPLPRLYLPALSILLGEDGPLTEAAARLALGFVGEPELLPVWQRLLWSEDLEVARLAATAVGRSGMQLSRWGLNSSEMLRLPAAVLASLLEEMRPGVLAPRELLPLLKRPEVGARLAAAMALRGCSAVTVLRALRRCLRDPNDAVAVACARCLLQHGQEEHRWVLLRSDLSEVREKTAGLLLKQGCPRFLAEEYRSGRCYNLETLRLLPKRRRAELVRQALETVENPDAAHLLALGPSAMDLLPELLGHPRMALREIAVEALESLLALPEVQAWLRDNGRRLPLDLPESASGPEQKLLDRIHRLLLEHCDALEASPMWLCLSRSEYWDTASRGLHILARGSHGNPDFAKGLLAGLGHFEPQVRRFTLQLVAEHLPPTLWESSAESQEGWLLWAARRFQEGALEPPDLQKALELLGQWGLQECSLFAPTYPRAGASELSECPRPDGHL